MNERTEHVDSRLRKTLNKLDEFYNKSIEGHSNIVLGALLGLLVFLLIYLLAF